MQASAKATLYQLVEDHLTQLIREAACVQRHSKRARVVAMAEDDSSDFSANDNNFRRRLTAQDINLALQWRGSEKLYSSSSSSGEEFDLGIISQQGDKKVVDLNAYLKSEMQVRPPSELGLSMHWLAVDGTQPDIVQNPQPKVGGEATTTVRVAGGPAAVQRDDTAAAGTTTDGTTTDSGVSIRQLLPRLLSEELQLYFTRVTLAMERGGATPLTRQQQDAALASVAHDGGLQELVPFFVRYVSQQLYQYMSSDNPDHCRVLVRLAHSLLSNHKMHLELHLHQLLPALLTCVVAAQPTIGKSSSGTTRQNNQHWALRQEAAETLLQACNLFGQEYATLKARVLKSLCEATAPDKPLSTQFGGIVAISLFGPKAIDAFLLLPSLATTYWEAWDKALAATAVDDDDDSRRTKDHNDQQHNKTKRNLHLEHRLELRQCQQAILNALSIYMQNVSPQEQAMALDRDKLVDVFGEKLVVLQNEPDDYAMCIV